MAARTSITKAHWNLIVNRISEDRCVPFLGAGVNVSDAGRNYQGLPLGCGVASKLIEEVSDFKGRDRENLARIALEYEFETDRPQLISGLRTILPYENCKPSPLLKNLASLPFKLIITTNYDCLMEQALSDEGKQLEPLVQPIEGFLNIEETQKLFDRLSIYDKVIVYKIHGTFDENNEYPVIITEDDYIEFLTVAGRREERIGIPQFIESRITPSTILFLGYSLEDWDFRTIYKGLIEKINPHRAFKSFAIQKDPNDFWVEFWSKKLVEIYNVDLYDFADELTQRCKAAGIP
ncbi:MAG: SIR2 family protein [Pyrinomonadaceae bacterium]